MASGLVTNRISEALEDAREAPAIAKKNELDARRHNDLDEKIGRLSKQFEDFAARELKKDGHLLPTFRPG